jgi:hypothetical protein
VREFAHRDLAAEALLDRQPEIGLVGDREAKLMIVSRSASGRSIGLAMPTTTEQNKAEIRCFWEA